MNLSFGQSPWLLVLLLVLAVAASWWTYRTTVPSIQPINRWFLGTLRAVSLGLILFLLFEPVLQRLSTIEIDPVVAVLVDGSESMALADSLLADQETSVSEKLASIQASLQGMDVRYFSFGSDVQDLDSLSSFVASGSKTDISAALDGVADRLKDVPLSSVVLVSDGLYNTGRNPIHMAERYSVPVFAIAHGDSTTRRDLRIVQVVSNELTYQGSTVPVLVRVRNDGLERGELTITLSNPSGSLDQRSIPLPASGTEAEVELSFVASEAGRQMLSVNVSRFEGEATYRNNAQSLSVLVLDQKKRVAILAGAPSPDVSNMVRQLSLDETAEVLPLVQAPDGSFYQNELPADLKEYDLVVAIGFPGKATPPSVASTVAEAIGQGVPWLFMLDGETDLGALQRMYASLLPVTLSSARPGFIEGSLITTPAAASHAIFDTGQRSDNANWNRLPPILLNESRWAATPSATVLATSQIRGIPIGDPLFAIARNGQTKSAALLAHGFWKWTNVPEDLTPEADVFKAVLANTLQWLYATDDNRLVRVQPNERDYAEGEPVVIQGEVYDETLRPVSDASLSIQLVAPDGQQYPYEMMSVGSGRYSLDVGSLPAGAYEYSASAKRNDGEIGTDSGGFTIGARTLEFRNTKADFALMAQIADRSGGVSLSDEDLNTLPDILRSLPGFSPESITEATQSRLWQKLPFLLAILLLLTVEWFFRKRFGMV